MYGEYDNEILNHLHQVELMILKDFIEICEKNNLEYFSYAGTTLGAIRHGGFIPWDDDIDVIMFRDEYEKFLRIMEQEKSEKYEILNMDKYDDYFLIFSKMSLKGTKIDEMWTKNTSFDVGINIDIFVLDYVPSNKFKWFIFHRRCELLKDFSYMLMIFKNDYYSSNFKRILGYFIKIIFKLLGLSRDTLYNRYNKLVKKSKQYDDLVYDFYAISYDDPFSESIFRPLKKVKFESIEVNVPNDFDAYLRNLYGDYMTPPPENERLNHFREDIDFGDY